MCVCVRLCVCRKRKRTEDSGETLNANAGFVWGDVTSLPQSLLLRHESDSEDDDDGTEHMADPDDDPTSKNQMIE